jgi:hypothetical protein
VTAYASEFQRLQAFISWNDQAFYDQFYDGLRENVKDALANLETGVKTLEDLIQTMQRIDNRIAERIREKRFSHASPQSVTTSPVYDTLSEPSILSHDITRLSKKPFAQE